MSTSNATTGSSSAAAQPNAATTGQNANPTPPANNGQAGTAATAMLNAATGVTFTPEQVQALLAVLGGTTLSNASTAQAPVVTALVNMATFPLFIFASAQAAPAGMSLLDLFSMIEGSVLLEIVQHEFKPGDLSKLDPHYKDCTQRQILNVSSGVVLVRNQVPRDYPTFHSLYIPLSMYFDVLASFAATGGTKEALYQVTASTSAYLVRLVQFVQEYQWLAVVAYHFAFHFKHWHDMVQGNYSSWATIDTALQAEFLIRRDRACGTAGKPSSGGSGKPHETDVCCNFNKGNCPSPSGKPTLANLY